MFVRTGASASTALNYLVTTAPSPLEITPADTTFTPATISVTAANPGPDPVRVVSVKFTLVAGTGAGALTEHLDQIHATVTPGADWSFTNGEDGTFLAMPTSDQGFVEVTDKAVLFELTNIAVNGEIGVTTLDILERTQDEDGDTSKGTAEFQLGKCFPGFQFSDLTPAFLDDGHTTVTNGDTATLTWTASHGAAYTMLHENKSYDVTNTRTWTSPTLTRDATFHLRASLTTDGHTVTHYLHTNVTVDKPDLTLGTLTVNGSLTANSDIDAVGSNAIVRIRELLGPSGEDLQINSNTHVLSGNDVTVEGSLSAVGSSAIVRIRDLRGPSGEDLTINSNTHVLTGNDVTIEDTLTTNGSATVNGLLTANGDLDVWYKDNNVQKLTTAGVTGGVKFPGLVVFNSCTINQGDWTNLKNFSDGQAKFHIWNTMYTDDSKEAVVFVYDGKGDHRNVTADFGSPGVGHIGQTFRFVFE
ncbi:hypothetical protein ACFVTF_08200 [Kitasatospora sp. NPDC057940]|uniref:hypothetical protein n=1 Tax=Kitasatospora sp. NPDC057940 TaxID=3346285 RepID=UPI0036DEEC23